ncbi:hypothetical protein [Riemerella anatipestifer]|uniref:hypothetical protein n=1 Tax=Riemerella anatipestifer TaxID=34085 RepID=UPI00236420A6|nr:hypothetical protein [Riemerella anatipestifer]MDD1525640.1 hypothetical protein [Riemerella anatipestifer]
MGLSKAIIAIKGNYTDKLEKIVDILNYMEDDDIINEFSQNAKLENGWTIIVDEEMVFVAEEDLLSELSEELKTEIFTFTIQSTSATYGFSNFNNGKNRIFLVQDGEIIENTGDKMKVEITFNIDENASIEDILNIAKYFEIELED